MRHRHTATCVTASSLWLLATATMMVGCFQAPAFEGSDGLDASVASDLPKDGDAKSSEVEDTADVPVDTPSTDVPEVGIPGDTEDGGDTKDSGDAEDDGDVADSTDTSTCNGCLLDDGTCVPVGQACVDSDDNDCFKPLCVTAGTACANVVVESTESCGPAGCGGTCSSTGVCGYKDLSGCSDVNLAFVASVPAPLDAGLAGLDSHCAQIATAAGLPSTSWAAWAGTSANSLSERFGDAQAWIRMDGKPIAQTLGDLQAGTVWYPVLLDENGAEPLLQEIATGLSESGGTAESCSEFGTAQSGGVLAIGHAASGYAGFSNIGTRDCSSSLSVACFQVSHSTGLVSPPVEQGRLVFVSSGTFTPGNGPAPAHALCQAEAEQNGAPPGIYRALINGGGGVAMSPGAHWVRFDGLRVFQNEGNDEVPNLLSQVPQAPLVRDSLGAPTSSQSWAGLPGGNPCSNWSDNTGQGTPAYAGYVHQAWLTDSAAPSISCASPAHVWCAQDTVEESECNLNECVVNDACIPAGPVASSTCLRCDPETSRFVLQSNDAACPTDAASCLIGACNLKNDVCETVVAPDGAACTNADLCTLGDTCQAGVCNDGGSTLDCSALVTGPCEEAICNSTKGACEAFPLADSTPCSDENACTLGDACMAGICAGGADKCGLYNSVFTTNTAFDAAFGGVVGADALCQEAALTADLGGTYMAWLSDSTNDALTRVQAASAGGGYVRPDGQLVATNLLGFAEGRIVYPPNTSASGIAIDADAEVWSATNLGGGRVIDAHCDDWTSSATDGISAVGLVHSNAAAAFLADFGDCFIPRHLRCLQVDSAAVPPIPTPQVGRYAFVSSPEFVSTAGAANADAVCQKDAAEAGLPAGVYKALLPLAGPTPSGPMGTPDERFDLTGGNWTNVKGVPVTTSAAAFLTSGETPLVPLNLTAAGVPVEQFVSVTVGSAGIDTPSDGAVSCNSWTGGSLQLEPKTLPGLSIPSWYNSRSVTNCDDDDAVFCLQDSPANLAFISNGTYTGDLGGVDGAAQICTNEAASAGLSGNYVAMLSTQTSEIADALTTAGGRGWVRMDYRPVANSAADWPSGELMHAPVYNGLGEKVAANALMWTGMSSDGAASGVDCSNWTSDSVVESGRTGYAGAGGHRLVFAGNSGCHIPRHLACLQVDHDVVVEPPPPAPGRYAFVSAEAITPGGGLAAADAICAQEALTAGLPGSIYKALLATESATAISRFSPSGGTWIRPDGIAIAKDVVAFGDAGRALLAGITQLADGTQTAANFVFTGAPSLTAVGDDSTCENWTTTAGVGARGVTGMATAGWFTDGGTTNCNVARAVYCLQDI